MMTRLFIISAFAFCSIHAAAQFVISGSVTDEKTKGPLIGATIQTQDLKHHAITDQFGAFRLEKLPPGDYILLIKFLGYTTKTETVVVNQDVTISVALAETAFITEEVVITTTRASGKTPATYTNVNRAAIQKQNFGQDLPYILNWTPSIVTTSDAGNGIGYTNMRIRGSDNTRINITINGVPYNDSESLGTFLVDIPDIASSSQSIQIQRGVGTSTNGAGAFGASINLQTNIRNDDPYGEVINSFGMFNKSGDAIGYSHRHTISFGSGLMRNRWIMEGRLSTIKSDGFIDRASSDLQSYYVSGGYYEGKTMVKAIVFGGKERTYQSWYGVPESRLNNDIEAMFTTAANEGWNEEQTNNLLNSESRTFNAYTYQNQVDNYNQHHYQLHFSHRFNPDLIFNTSWHYTRGYGYYEEYKYNDAFENYGLPNVILFDDDPAENDTIRNSDLIRRRWLDNHFYGVTYSLNYEREKVNLIIGGAWNRYDGDHFGEILWSQVTIAPHGYQYYFNNGDKRDFNVFTKATYHFNEKINGYVDLQYRTINYTVLGTENEQNALGIQADYKFFNPKFGVLYEFNSRQQAYASYSIAHREPVRDDFTATPGLNPRPEVLFDFEAGYKRAFSDHTLSVNFYRMDYQDQLVLTGELNDVGAAVRKNVGSSYRMGLEIDGIVKISEKFSWSANIAVSQNKVRNFTEALVDYGENFDQENVVIRDYKNTDISFSPPVVAGSGLSVAPVKGLEVTWLSKWVGKQYLDNTSDENRKIDSYFVNDLVCHYTWRPSFLREMVFGLQLNNLLNEGDASNGYTWGFLAGPTAYRENYYYPQVGRNIMVMLTLKF